MLGISTTLIQRPDLYEAFDLWVVSDLTPGLDGAPVAVGPDHVLGISPCNSASRWKVR